MQQLNNFQIKILDGGGEMREMLLYKPIQEYKYSNKILSCFLFFKVRCHEIITSPDSWGWIHRRTNNVVKKVSEHGMRKTRGALWETCWRQGKNFIHCSKVKTRSPRELLGQDTLNWALERWWCCGQYWWYFGQCREVNAEESQIKKLSLANPSLH